MKKLLTLIIFSGMALGASAQLVNQGGTITIQPGATLVVESDITNNGAGVITNNGTIEVKGDLTSAATASFASGSLSLLKFSGSTPSTVSFLATTMLTDVEMAKTDENVTLASDMDINGNLTFTEDDNQIVLGANNLVLSSTSSADNSAVTNSFIVTDGQGTVTKEGLSTAFEFPVGGAIDSQNDITLTESGTADNISVRVLADAYDTPSTAMGTITDEVVNATWVITEATAGGSSLTVAPSWAAADETATFDNTDAAVYQFDGTDYTALAANGAATTTNGVSEISNTGLVLDGTDYVIVADSDKARAALLAVKMFLQGPYSAATSLMTDALRTGSLIPTTEPYTGLGFTHVLDGGSEMVSSAADFDAAGTDDDIVDWVFIELRDATDMVISTRSALLQRDGDVVDVDGSAVAFGSLPDGMYSTVIRHRNHLGVKSASMVQMTKGSTATFDFTTSAAQSTGGDQPEVESGVFGMWGGDTSGDGTVRYLFSSFPFPVGTPSDADAILFNGLSNVPNGSLNAYSQYDVNMDGTVRYLFSSFPFPIGTPSDADAILFNTLLNVPNSSKTANY